MQEELEAVKEQLHSDEPPSKRRRSTRVIPSAPSKLAKVQVYRAGKAAVLLYHPWPTHLESVFAKRSDTSEYPQDAEPDVVSDDDEGGEEEDSEERRDRQRRNQERFRLKLFNGTAVPGSRVQRGLAEQKSDNALRMRSNLVDIFEIKSSTSAELKIQKNRQEDEEIQRHINHESYIYAAYEVPAQGTSSHQKSIKAAAYLRSPALFRIARIIVHGPATITSVNRCARGATTGSNLSIHQITIPLMAYSSTLARYALSGDVAFSAEGTVPIKLGTTEVNDYRQHFERTVKLLSTIRAQHEDKFTDLISIWNKEVFPQDNAERDSSAPHHGTSDADI
ncbi:hypothetical protein BT69DRAFT_1335483 [Atractiella rhizophila]|nr:hypothetical protein BT69DRAFT_1335483 [Atractiella rhizophila]